MAFGNYDNELRREKSKRGMIENLLNGYWVGVVPFGYTNLRRKEKAKYHEYVINKDGEILKLAFKWKAEGQMNNEEIVAKMQKMGSTIKYKSFVRIISNPFYCGYLVNSLIPGQVIKGKHPALVSEELFLRANQIVTSNPHKGISKKYKNTAVPLKSFLRSEVSGLPFTAYLKKGHYYYKTRGKGDAVNERADVVNELFMQEMAKLKVEDKHRDKIEGRVKELVFAKFENNKAELEAKRRRLGELLKKIESLEERYIEGELDRELYEKYMSKYKSEREEMREEIENANLESSNLEKAIKKGLEILQDPLQLWLSSSYDDKQRLQYLLFPEGLWYNKEKREVRTPRVNSVVFLITGVARVTTENKKGHLTISDLHSHLVVPTRIELVSKV
ncbi:MAG: recombinase family protein [Bacteroidota bacterium]|nr:recombinase family protein [Bacteroidota bacterium]